MMFDDQLFQPDQILPEGQEPEILELKAAPYDDRRRVHVFFRISPFSAPPCAALRILNSQGEEQASADLVNILHLESEITLHLPADGNQPGEYQVVLDLFRQEDQAIEGEQDLIPEIKRTDLHTRSTSFILP